MTRRAVVPFVLLALSAVACRQPEAPVPEQTAPAPRATATPAPPIAPAPDPAPASGFSSAPPPARIPAIGLFPDLRPGGDVSQPRLTGHQEPPAPIRCYPLSIQGPEASFVFEIGVDERGAVTGVRTLASPSFSSPCPEFEPLWHAAILQWRYEPALRRGKPVPVTVRVFIDIKR